VFGREYRNDTDQMPVPPCDWFRPTCAKEPTSTLDLCSGDIRRQRVPLSRALPAGCVQGEDQRKPPDSADAWDLVMRPLSHHWRVTREDNVVAQALLEKATAIDPNYGQALGLLATTYTFSAHMGWGDFAERAAHAATLADGDDAWAHLALGCVYLFARRFDDSLAEFETALRLNPNFSLAQGYYGLTLSYCGQWQEGELAARRALRLSPHDPLSAIYFGIASYTQFVGKKYDEAMRLAREGVRQRIDFVGAHRVLTAAAGMAGQIDVAKAALQELRRAQPNISLDWIAKQMPIKHDVEREHYLEGFGRAGLAVATTRAGSGHRASHHPGVGISVPSKNPAGPFVMRSNSSD
jgi:Tfp pilus assembly protein PilF